MNLKDIKVGEEYAVCGYVAKSKRMVATEVGVVGIAYDRGTEYRSTEADFVRLTPLVGLDRPVTEPHYNVLRTWAEEVRDKRLRDAAPDLLEAAKPVLAYLDDLHGMVPEFREDFIEPLRAAIARAEDAAS